MNEEKDNMMAKWGIVGCVVEQLEEMRCDSGGKWQLGVLSEAVVLVIIQNDGK